MRRGDVLNDYERYNDRADGLPPGVGPRSRRRRRFLAVLLLCLALAAAAPLVLSDLFGGLTRRFVEDAAARARRYERTRFFETLRAWQADPGALSAADRRYLESHHEAARADFERLPVEDRRTLAETLAEPDFAALERALAAGAGAPPP